jgi:hypothetical protein
MVIQLDGCLALAFHPCSSAILLARFSLPWFEVLDDDGQVEFIACTAQTSKPMRSKR